MLDQQTKKRIDDCRNILVGKITDPKSQVEQITIALIYKFMDDMDTEAVEMGGFPTYFVGEYERYSWKNIFSPRIGGDEMLSLYGEGMVKMNLNPSLPQLFRDIFKNAYLPYRDPETLKLFLRTINEFKYDHSERLGDAFEYLLSVLGSQGDAGQFRTPRHIIDFLVNIIDPKKNETMMDPACGTSGFLISGFKHILNANTNTNIGDKLTPDERKKLTNNITGFDISPDMVRLSLVNLFLHGFTNPRVYEYDTLTSEDRWNEYYDVILANPPFMSPKGGIRPHKRFGVESNRAEVLFVDYIMEHLTPNGRAGIVVPEGVIFQSGTAYKSLRKIMVEKYLIGVISLPSGVFQPYSGVKTSILVFDRGLSQKTDKIFFGKVENDGFDLGAQRREIEKNDLPIITKEVSAYLEGLRNGKLVDSEKLTYVSKEQILGSSDIGLSYDRYIEKKTINSSFPIVDIESVYKILPISKKIKSSDFLIKGKYPIVDQSDSFISGFWNEENDLIKIDIPVIIFGDHSRVFKFIDFDFVAGADGIKILEPIINKVVPKYLFFILKNIEIKNLGYSRHYKELKEKKIPLPPLEIQDEIVKALEQYQKIIDGARIVVENYKPVIDIDPSWEMKELREFILINNGISITNFDDDGNLCYIKVSDMNIPENHFEIVKSNNKIKYNKDNYIRELSVLFPKRGAAIATNKKRITKVPCVIDSNCMSITSKDFNVLNPYFLYFFFLGFDIAKISNHTTIPLINNPNVQEIILPIPPIEIQKSIVDQIEKEREIIEGNKKLIEIYTQKIQDRINKVWGE